MPEPPPDFSVAPFAEIAALDRLVHEPARLAILAALAACQRADFVYLRRLTGLSKGNLASHLSKLEAADYVASAKETRRGRARTFLSLTKLGRQTLSAHWARLDALRTQAEHWGDGQ
ncbi:MAG: transcriptional regulator [Bacteroidota bacterium]